MISNLSVSNLPEGLTNPASGSNDVGIDTEARENWKPGEYMVLSHGVQEFI